MPVPDFQSLMLPVLRAWPAGRAPPSVTPVEGSMHPERVPMTHTAPKPCCTSKLIPSGTPLERDSPTLLRIVKVHVGGRKGRWIKRPTGPLDRVSVLRMSGVS